MLTFLIIVLVCFAVFGAVLAWPLRKDPANGKITVSWEDKRIEGQIGGAIILASLVALAFCYWKYTASFQDEADRQKARVTEIDSDLQQAKAATKETEQSLTKTKDELNSAQTQLQTKSTDATRLQLRFEAEQAERREAQAMLRSAWELMNDNQLSADQKAELDTLSRGVDALNAKLTYVQISRVERPQFAGRKPIGVYEVYSKAFSADEIQPRGAGLFDFQIEQFKLASDYQGRLLEVLRSQIAQAICEAAQSAMVGGISLTDAISRIPSISNYDLNRDFIGTLTESTYVKLQFSLLAGSSRVLVRGYADDQRGPFRRPLDNGPRHVDVHEEVHPSDLLFQSTLTPKLTGREERGAASYGNNDLPNLRAAVTADLLGLITCTAPGIPASASSVSIELLDGRVYPEFRKEDRRARVYLLAFLKEP
jgi:hypothetical protein